LREKPAGTIRITTSEHAANTVLWPVLQKLLPDYPDVHVELTIDSGLTDIVAERFDVGVRLGESIARDMVAVRIGPDLGVAVVGSPAYFAHHAKPRTPQDLASHQCINLRLPTAGGLYAWELGKGERDLRVRVEGQLVFNNVPMILRAAVAGFGLACVLGGRSACRRRQPRGACWRTGVRCSPAIISIAPVGASLRRHLRCSLMRCAIGAEGGVGRCVPFSAHSRYKTRPLTTRSENKFTAAEQARK
jgi:DNA-binding transcriptional LysR family regulator